MAEKDNDDQKRFDEKAKDANKTNLKGNKKKNAAKDLKLNPEEKGR